MDFRIDWTAPAIPDFEKGVRFIATHDPAAAILGGDKIVDHFETLRTFPEIGPVYRQSNALSTRQITCRTLWQTGLS